MLIFPDTRAIDWSDPRAQALTDLLSEAYPVRSDLLSLAARVDIQGEDIPAETDVEEVCRIVLQAAVARGRLRDLVAVAQDDPARAAFAERWKALRERLHADAAAPSASDNTRPTPAPPLTSAPSAPKSAREAFWLLAWKHLPPAVRIGLVVAFLLLGAGLATWATLPSATKEAVISRIFGPEPPATGFWRVFATLGATVVEPGAFLDLTVEVDHNGYVWVFTVEDERGVLLYPQEEDAAVDRHRIVAGRRRAVPGPKDAFGLQAGTDAGDEVLIVITTGHSSKTTAWACLAALRPDLRVKPAPIRTGPWGATQLRYEVKEK